MPDEKQPCTGNCDGENEGELFTFVPGVTAHLCAADQGQVMADVIADLKSYGFEAAEDADELYDEIKGIG